MVVFTCALSKAGQTVSWHKDGRRIAGKGCVVSSDGHIHKLTISKCTIHDAGEYTVKAGKLESNGNLIINGETLLKMKDFMMLSFS